MVRDLVLTAQRGPEGITVTAYRQPSLDRRWSAVVPDHTVTNDQGDGNLYLSECGPAVCMTVHRAGTWPINPATGSVAKPITFELVGRLGGGVFVASPLRAEPRTNRSIRQTSGFLIDSDGRAVARLMVADLVDWSDSGDRVLTTQEGQARTDFRVIDGRGTARTLGSVPGTGLTCHARADILACSDSAGTLRVWRLPVWRQPRSAVPHPCTRKELWHKVLTRCGGGGRCRAILRGHAAFVVKAVRSSMITEHASQRRAGRRTRPQST